MYTSEDVNGPALYNLHYSGTAKRTQDAQEQYEALLTSWGYNTEPSAFTKAVKTAFTVTFKTLKKLIKSSYNTVTASSILAKQHAVSAHISAR